MVGEEFFIWAGDVYPIGNRYSTTDDLMERKIMSPLLLVILIVFLIAVVPAWPYSRGWGYYPSGGIGTILLVILLLWLLGVI